MSHDHTTSERSGEAEPTGAAPLAGDAPRDRDHDGFDATTDSGSLPVVAEAIEPVGGTSAVALVDRPDPSPDEGGAIGAAESVAALGAGDVLGPTPGDAALDAGPTIVARPPYPPPPPPVPLVPADGTPEAEAAPDDSKPEAKAAPDDSTAESKRTPDGNTPESKAAPDPAPAVTTATLATTPTTSTAEASARPGPTTTTTSPPAAVAPARTRAAAGKLGYLPALDGLRAVAVLLVIGYHLGYSGLAGGFIGVEVFFVLSGWLVCALLMGESRAAGRIGLGGFWLRRARRLLPAMVVVTFVTLAVATVLTPDRVADLRGDAFAALTYHLNWRLILDSQSYFAAADGPSALQHLWSLSIEEQFYLVFPLLASRLTVKAIRFGLLVAFGHSEVEIGEGRVTGSRYVDLVLVTPEGHVSVILMADEHPSQRVLVADRRMTALLSPAPSGAYIVVAESPKAVKRAQKLFVQG